MKKRTIMLVALTLLPIGIGQVPAKDEKDWSQDHESRMLSDRFYGTLGGFLVTNTTDAAVGSGGLIGTNISLEDTLGLDQQKRTVRSDGFWRFGPKHSLGWTLFSFKRTGTNALTEDITFDDVNGEPVTFSVGVLVDSDFTTSLLGLNYRYSFINNGKTEAGISAALSFYTFKFGLEGIGAISDGMGGVTVDTFNPEESLAAPVPSAGLFINHAFTPKFLIKVDANWFRLDYDDLSGRLTDTIVGLEYYFGKHVGIGGGVSQTDIDVSVSGTDPWSVTYRYNGLLAYVSGVF